MSLRTTLDALVRHRTVTGAHAEADACLAYIEQELSQVPLYVRKHRYNGYPSLIATTKRTKAPALWLAGHIDVVPAPASAFVPRREGDLLFGRGVFDMKGPIACYLELFKELGPQARDYDIGLMLTSDEELGGYNGTRCLLQQAGYRGKVVFLPDGGGVWKFEEKAKGKWQVKVVTKGISSHGSRPWSGRSATQELVRYLADAERGFAAFERSRTPEDHWHLTMHAGLIGGGDAPNMLACHAEATLDIRYTAQSEVARATRLLDRLARMHPNTTWETMHNEQPHKLEHSNEYARLFARMARDAYGIRCGWARAHGSSDARYFTALDIPVLLICPSGGGHHTDDEWVDGADLERYYAVLRSFVAAVGKVRG